MPSLKALQAQYIKQQKLVEKERDKAKLIYQEIRKKRPYKYQKRTKIIVPPDVQKNIVDVLNYTLQKYFYSTLEDYTTESRQMEIVVKRHCIINILREQGLTVEVIGKIVNRDHSTISYAIKNHESNLKYLIGYSNDFNKMKMAFNLEKQIINQI